MVPLAAPRMWKTALQAGVPDRERPRGEGPTACNRARGDDAAARPSLYGLGGRSGYDFRSKLPRLCAPLFSIQSVKTCTDTSTLSAGLSPL